MIPNYFLYGLLKSEDRNFKNYFQESYKFFNKNEGDFIINLSSKTHNERVLYVLLNRFSQSPVVQKAFADLKDNLTEQPYKSSGFWHLSDGYLEENDGLAEFAKVAIHISNKYIFYLFSLEKKKIIDLFEFARYSEKVLEQIYENISNLPDEDFSSYSFAESAILHNIISNLKSLLLGNSIIEKLFNSDNNGDNP